MSAIEPLACAVFLLAAFSVAGVVHVLWMRSAWSSRLSVPLHRRWFGAHKTLRGFVALVPAAGVAFCAFGAARESLPAWFAAGIWPLDATQLFLLGLWAGFWFMAGELPNSLLKRRWGIAPGTLPDDAAARALCLVADRVDSILAMLIALALVVPVPFLTWVLVLAAGPAVHLVFSALLWLANVKERLA